MRIRGSGGLLSWSWAGLALFTCAAQGGLSIEAASSRERALADGAAWHGLVPLLPAPGLSLAWGEPQRGLPLVIAESFPGRGGLQAFHQWPRQGALGVHLGAAWREGRDPRVNLEGSALTWDLGRDAGHGELYASVQRRHWGPGWSGSLILDAAAPAVPAFGWRRTAPRTDDNPWTSWLGPWGADIFVGRLQGHEQPERPAFVGMRLVLAPIDGLELGFSRTMQWGGRGRDERWSTFVNALWGNDNVGFEGITAENEPGNQLAGIDLRWTVDAATQTSVYAQVIGEDEAGKLPSRNMALLGLDTRWTADGHALRLFVEWADLLAGRVSRDPRPYAAYRHSVFRQGYVQEGRPLGHPAGGDVTLGSLGGLYQFGPWSLMAIASAGRAEPSAQLFAAGHVLGADAALQFRLDAASRLHAAWTWWSDTTGRRHSARIGWQLGW